MKYRIVSAIFCFSILGAVSAAHAYNYLNSDDFIGNFLRAVFMGTSVVFGRLFLEQKMAEKKKQWTTNKCLFTMLENSVYAIYSIACIYGLMPLFFIPEGRLVDFIPTTTYLLLAGICFVGVLLVSFISYKVKNRVGGK